MRNWGNCEFITMRKESHCKMITMAIVKKNTIGKKVIVKIYNDMIIAIVKNFTMTIKLHCHCTNSKIYI